MKVFRIFFVLTDDVEDFVFRVCFWEILFDECDDLRVVLACLCDECFELFGVVNVRDVFESVVAEDVEDVTRDEIECEELIKCVWEDHSEMFFHSVFHALHFDSLLVEGQCTAQCENRHVFNAKDLIFVGRMIHAGISVEILLFLNTVELFDNVTMRFFLR